MRNANIWRVRMGAFAADYWTPAQAQRMADALRAQGYEVTITVVRYPLARGRVT